jgi:hypothetical protein
MKRLRLIAPAVAMALATTLVAGPKEDCLQKAKTDHRAAQAWQAKKVLPCSNDFLCDWLNYSVDN